MKLRKAITVSEKGSAPLIKHLQYNILNPTSIYREAYPWASKNALKWSFRKKLFMEEITHLNADIISFQEVAFYSELASEFAQLGYESKFLPQKPNIQNSSGIAIFWKKIIGDFQCKLLDYIPLRYNELHKDFKNQSVEFERNNLGQIAVLSLESESKSYGLIVSNTHLFWKPEFNFVRTLQLHSLIHAVLDLHQKYHYPMILGGDYNFTPDDLEYAMMTKNRTLQDMMDELLHPTNPHFDEIAIKEADLIRETIEIIMNKPQLYPFKSAYSIYQSIVKCDHKNQEKWTTEPPYTTFGGYAGLLDYIFYDKLDLVSLLEIPPPQEIKIGIPNDDFMSDHFCIMATFGFDKTE